MRITVIGAYGYTGQLICHELLEAGILFSIAGRNSEKLEALKMALTGIDQSFHIDLRLQSDVDHIVSVSDIIINCAGPFTEESALLLEKVASSGKIYLDISGEVGFIKNSRENYHQKAIESNSLIIHGCAFESMIADLLIQMENPDEKKIQIIRTFYWFNQMKTSPGTRITMKLSKFRKNLKISGNRWIECDFATDKFDVQWSPKMQPLRAIPYPLPEIAYSYWNYNPEVAESYLLLTKEEAKYVMPVTKSSDQLFSTLENLRIRKIAGPTKQEREDQRSCIILYLMDDKSSEKHLLIESKDMYQTTAKVIVSTIQKIRKSTKIASGVISPASLFTKQEKVLLKMLNVDLISSKTISIQPC